ncbi:shootin-1-like isoform X1 [Phymastichus coffea]|uniref:shootin-1-like isoform X1 n=1 Tax=Phymastichus coffea TaxID=108790 RepID=UPI00273B04D0|nr:shootin-1-like isoform X1 [Phymastichus coffea]
MSSSDSEEEVPFQPESQKDGKDSIPAKSKLKYEKAYETYVEWKKKIGVTTTENWLIEYFNRYMQKYKPPSVLAHYSMLKSLIKVHENINIGNYSILNAKLKTYATGYESKKSLVFTNDQLSKYLQEAPDRIHLANKVVMIFGIMGCCRVDEITKIRVSDIKKEGQVLIVNIPKENAKNNKPRKFTIYADMSAIVKKYLNLRSKGTPTDRVFVNYQKGLCTKQPIGKNKMHSIPKQIARWLELDDPSLYSGLAIRHTADTFLSTSDVGTTIVLNRLKEWNRDDIDQTHEQDPLGDDSQSNLPATSANLNGKVINDQAYTYITHTNLSDEDEQQPECSAPLSKRRKIDQLDNPSTSASDLTRQTNSKKDQTRQTNSKKDHSWYQQNRELKRRSQVITQRYLQANPDALNDFDLQDEVDNHADDIEQLRETVTELSQEVAKLQTELSAARLQEFEAQEQVTHLTAQLEEERVARENEEENVRKIKTQKENMERVTKMVADEVQALKTQCDNERENARMAKIEADKIQKERNVLAHQSALLMVDVGNDPSGRLLVLLQEVETLKRTLEEEKQAHAAQIQVLQEKLEEKESNVEFEIVEEKLKLSEAELVMVEQRAERAENIAEAMKGRVRELELKVAELEKKASAPPPPPLPPPPPPPPMPTSSTNGSPSLKLITREKLSSETNNSAVENMENMLGINKKSPPMPQQPAIDDIINQIKGGRFTLKQTDKQREEERKRKQEEESKPPAVSEMLNILGTMRRRAKPTRNSIKFSNGPS